MGTLASELTPHVTRGSAPRIYADANIPNGVVHYMRAQLGWDVFFVLEHEELRRARDVEHYRMARQLARTLITQDRDYEDDSLFPPEEGAGVIVFVSPDERRLCELLALTDRSCSALTGPRLCRWKAARCGVTSVLSRSWARVVPDRRFPEQLPAPHRLKIV